MSEQPRQDSLLQGGDEEADAGAPPAVYRRTSLRRSTKSLLLPALGPTPIAWRRIEKFQRFCCCCFSFVTSVVLVAICGSILFGFNTSLLNTSINTIASDFQFCQMDGYLSCNQGFWFNSILTVSNFIGATVGSLSAGKFMHLGPRMVFLISLAVFTFGIINSVVAEGFYSLLWARLVVGYGVGLVSVVVPTYISEMSPPNLRGAYGSLHQLFINIGVLAATCLGIPFTPIPTDPDTGPVPSEEQISFVLPTFDRWWWRIMLGTGLIPVFISGLFFGAIFSFETPHYYVKKLQNDSAIALLQHLHNKQDVQREFLDIKEQIKEGVILEQTGMSLGRALNTAGYRRAIWVGLIVSIFQQLTGINAFMASSNKLFAQAGLTGRSVTLASVCLMGINCIATIPAVCLIEKLGRRTLLLWGVFGMALSVTPAGVLYIMNWNNNDGNDACMYAALLGAVVFLVCYALSYGPTMWVYLFEIYPLSIKAAGSSLATAVNWIAGILIVLLASILDNQYTYTIFMAMGYLAFFLILCFVRETKGRQMGDSPYVST